jgi:hypothetical protein
MATIKPRDPTGFTYPTVNVPADCSSSLDPLVRSSPSGP